MQGRYGVDQLNNVLIIISIICFIINMFVGNIVIGILHIYYGLLLFLECYQKIFI